MALFRRADVTFILIYVTFVLDNVLLTTVVPLVPQWVGQSDVIAPVPSVNASASPLLSTAHGDSGRAVWAGVILSSRAVTQLLAAPLARRCAAASQRGTLSRGTAALAAAAALLAAATVVPSGGSAIAVSIVGRVVHGLGSALAGVAGLAHAGGGGRLPYLLSATAIGVVVGYPLGGASANAGRQQGATVLIFIAGLLLTDSVLQQKYLEPEEECDTEHDPIGAHPPSPLTPRALLPCLLAITLSTSVLAALEPCLPPYLSDMFHPKVWVYGVVFVSDSVGYFVATTVCAAGSCDCRWAAGGRVAAVAQAVLGVAAVALTSAPSVVWLCLPQMILGACVGAVDAVLVPALLHKGRCELCQQSDCFTDNGVDCFTDSTERVYAARMAASVNAASAAAYAIGPSVGGLGCGALGLQRTLWLAGGTNALYALYLYNELTKCPLAFQCEHHSPTTNGQYLPLK